MYGRRILRYGISGVALMAAVIALYICLFPLSAYAQAALPVAAAPIQQGLDINACAPGLQEWQITGKIVLCIERVVVAAVVDFINGLTRAMLYTIAPLFLLAVILFGVRILAGDQELPKIGIGFIVRLSVVMAITYSLADFAALPYLIVGDFMTMINGSPPWIQIDLMMGRLLGFGPGVALFQGMLGLLGAALFSSATGMFMFLFGFLVIMSLMGLIFRAVYTYLLAVVLIGFVMCVSPLIVPLAVFGMTERYVKKWLDLLIAAMLQPVLLFAFLQIFLGMVDVYISELFNVLGGNDFKAFWRMNSPFFSWAMTSDPSLLQKFETQGMQKGAPLVQALMNPLMGRAMDLSVITHPGVDFGPQGLAKMQELIMAFAGMAIVCYLLRSMLEYIPRLADDIAGVSTGIGFEKIEFVENLKKAIAGAMK